MVLRRLLDGNDKDLRGVRSCALQASGAAVSGAPRVDLPAGGRCGVRHARRTTQPARQVHMPRRAQPFYNEKAKRCPG